MHADLALASQRLAPGNLVQLFVIDLNPIGEAVVFPFVLGQTPVSFQGVTYSPMDIDTDGWEYNGQGQMPQPKIKVGRGASALSSALILYNDLIGAHVTRLRTLEQFLDGKPTANPEAYYAPDVYVIQQKLVHDKIHVEWSLSAMMDQEGRKLPGRKVYRDLCSWRYRVWTGSAFDYSKATCPYAGSGMFNTLGQATANPAEDVCSRKLTSGCRVRYGTQPLPFGGFPGVNRFRQQG